MPPGHALTAPPRTVCSVTKLRAWLFLGAWAPSMHDSGRLHRGRKEAKRKGGNRFHEKHETAQDSNPEGPWRASDLP